MLRSGNAWDCKSLIRRFDSGHGLRQLNIKPGWRNGLRRGLKILDPYGFVGSTPTPGTTIVILYFLPALFLFLCAGIYNDSFRFLPLEDEGE